MASKYKDDSVVYRVWLILIPAGLHGADAFARRLLGRRPKIGFAG